MTPLDLFLLALLGGVLGLDTVSFPQAMISRPIVAATIAGAAMGEPLRGAVVGVALELFAVETLPFGASRYPEWGSASTVSGSLFALHDQGQAGALLTSVVIGLTIAWIGGWSMVQVRTLNARLARARHDAVARGSRRVVNGLQLAGLTADLVRGIALTGTGLLVGLPLQAWVLDTFGVPAALSRAVVTSAAAAVALGAVWKIFHTVPGARWLFLIGLAGGLAMAVWR